MKYYPLNILIVDEAGCLEVLCKIEMVNSFGLEAVKLDSCFFEEVSRLVNYFFFAYVELEVELPGADGVRSVALFVGDR